MINFEKQSSEQNSSETEQENDLCPYCGQPRGNNDVFCDNCGFIFKKLETGEIHIEQYDEQQVVDGNNSIFATRKFRSFVAGVLICLVALIAVVTGHIFLD